MGVRIACPASVDEDDHEESSFGRTSVVSPTGYSLTSGFLARECCTSATWGKEKRQARNDLKVIAVTGMEYGDWFKFIRYNEQ